MEYDNHPILRDGQILLAHEDLLNSQIISGSDVVEETWIARQHKKTGFQLPWSTLRDKFSIVKGEMTIVSGYSGHGKSVFVNQIALELVAQNVKVFIASFELSPGDLWDRVFQQITGASEDATYEYLSYVLNAYDRKIFTYDLLGHANVDKVLKSASLVADVSGAEVFIFDNLMMLNSVVDDFKVQHDITQKLLKFSQDRDVHVILVAHSKKPNNNSFGNNSTNLSVPGMYDVSGSSNIVNMVSNHLSVTTNNLKYHALKKQSLNGELSKAEEASLLMGDTIIMRDKARSIGENFRSGLYYDKKFQRLKDFESQKLKPYVEYSNPKQ